MKKIIFVTLFVMVLVSGVYGQTRAENRWLLGTWVATVGQNHTLTLVLNDNGTGRISIADGNTEEIIFSIVGNSLRKFTVTGRNSVEIFRENPWWSFTFSSSDIDRVCL